jgi:DNA-binding MarR family transcriptional regulator
MLAAVLSVTFQNLVKVEIALWDAVDARLRADHDLPLGRFQVLEVLARRAQARTGTSRVQDVAAELLITVGGVSKLCDRLEAANLCQRRPNPADRRSSLLELTPRGAQVLKQAQQSVEQELAERLSGLGVDELQTFTATLVRLARLSAPLTAG